MSRYKIHDPSGMYYMIMSVVGWSKSVIGQKINYIHQNPVRAGWVMYPEQYIYSSASNYRDEKGIIDILIPEELFTL